MADPVHPDPLRIECEGANCPTHYPRFTEGICAMCGQLVPVSSDGKAVRHWRADVLAMIERGDFRG